MLHGKLDPQLKAIGVGMKELLQAIRQPPEHYLCHQATKNPPHRILNSPRSHVLYLGMEKTLRSTGMEVTLVPRTLNREMGDMLQRSDPHRTHQSQNPIPVVTMVRVSTAVTMIRVSILMGLQNTDNHHQLSLTMDNHGINHEDLSIKGKEKPLRKAMRTNTGMNDRSTGIPYAVADETPDAPQGHPIIQQSTIMDKSQVTYVPRVAGLSMLPFRVISVTSVKMQHSELALTQAVLPLTTVVLEEHPPEVALALPTKRPLARCPHLHRTPDHRRAHTSGARRVNMNPWIQDSKSNTHNALSLARFSKLCGLNHWARKPQ